MVRPKPMQKGLLTQLFNKIAAMLELYWLWWGRGFASHHQEGNEYKEEVVREHAQSLPKAGIG